MDSSARMSSGRRDRTGSECLKPCEECAQNCLLIHSKRKDPSPIVTSFFKVMRHSEFSQVLFIPPKFAPTLSCLVNQTTSLEDSSGQCWTVTLAKVNDALAFQNGWHEFSSAHCLKPGDFLVFSHIKGSHFIVQIYDESGCEKTVLSKENSCSRKRFMSSKSSSKDGNTSKRFRTGRPHSGSSDKHTSSSDYEMSETQPIRADSGLNTSREKDVTAPIFVEEEIYMINRDAGYVQDEHRTAFYDLAEFEVMCPNEVQKNPSPDANSSLSEFETNANRLEVDGDNKITLKEERISSVAHSVMRSVTKPGVVGVDSLALETANVQSLTEAGVGATDTLDVEVENVENLTEAGVVAIGQVAVQAKNVESLTETSVVATNPVAVESPNVESPPTNSEHLIPRGKEPLPKDKFVPSVGTGSEKLNSKLGKSLDVSKYTNFKNPVGQSNAHSSGTKVGKIEIVDRFEPSGFHGKFLSAMSERDQRLKTPVETQHLIRKDKGPSSKDIFSRSAKKDYEKVDAKVGKSLPMSKNVLKTPEGGSNSHLGGPAKLVKTEIVDQFEPPSSVFSGFRSTTAVKTEPSFNSSPANTASISCVVEKIDQDFFELPKSLMSISTKWRSYTNVVLSIHDPLGMCWRFYCLQKGGLNWLKGGWKEFCEANSIQPGDECTFSLESEPDRIFKANIAHK